MSEETVALGWEKALETQTPSGLSERWHQNRKAHTMVCVSGVANKHQQLWWLCTYIKEGGTTLGTTAWIDKEVDEADGDLACILSRRSAALGQC